MKKVSDIIADFLKFKEIEIIFGIIGSANSHIFDSIERLGYTKIICLHHEQAAVMAMAAYYRASGKISATLVTAGAGASNSITGILSAWADSIPGLIISGQEPSRYLVNQNLRMYGTQGFKSSEMVSSITKYSKVVDVPNSIQNHLEHSYNLALEGRPGPIWLEIPFDIQSEMVNFENWGIKSKHEEVDIVNHIELIIESLKSSKKPIIIAGNGIKLSKSEDIFRRLVDKLDIPVLTTWSSFDILNENHQKQFGRCGLYGQRASNFIIQKSDLVICLGTRLAIPQVGYNFDEFAPKAKIIVVDIDETELLKYKRITGVKCDVKLIIDGLLKINLTGVDFSGWINKCSEIKLKNPLLLKEYYKNSQFINSYLFLNKFSKKLGKNDVVVTDMGTALLSGHQVMEATGYKMFTSQGLGEMGVGLPYAIGAAMASNNNVIHCLNCDGGIMMNIQELQTIKFINKNIKIIVFNNDGYLMIKHTQKMLFNGRYVGVDPITGVSFPNFEKIAEAFDLKYLKLNNWEQYDEVMKNYFDEENALLLEVFMDPEQDFIPKVKGVPVAQSNAIFSPPLEEMSPILPFDFVVEMMEEDLSEKSMNIDRK